MRGWGLGVGGINAGLLLTAAGSRGACQLQAKLMETGMTPDGAGGAFESRHSLQQPQLALLADVTNGRHAGEAGGGRGEHAHSAT